MDALTVYCAEDTPDPEVGRRLQSHVGRPETLRERIAFRARIFGGIRWYMEGRRLDAEIDRIRAGDASGYEEGAAMGRPRPRRT